ncbi:hypothetical protein CBR_g8894 [Chara braunii]|uniref:Uncharacterized protein n=1 Tax=Chara braunii TaxID=69332 RepID=A0A388KN98_CHABU|nr:hypothetical protein CBR_g8894 [Chara braunii]|eukprot:GBG71478.1 hypothetical protein CBR_g8894 [Chara braunii]
MRRKGEYIRQRRTEEKRTEGHRRTDLRTRVNGVATCALRRTKLRVRTRMHEIDPGLAVAPATEQAPERTGEGEVGRVRDRMGKRFGSITKRSTEAGGIANSSVDLVNEKVANIPRIREEGLHEDRTIEHASLDLEHVFIRLWGAQSEYHKKRACSIGLEKKEVVMSDDEEDEEMTEVERVFLRKQKEERMLARAALKKSEKKVEVSKFTRNAFLPLASSRWVESMSLAFQNRLWSLDTFNHCAPFGVSGFRFMAKAMEAELQYCLKRALDDVLELPNAKLPFKGDGVNFPPMHEIDPTKCRHPEPFIAMKSNAPPRNSNALNELKKVWNYGRLYFKCKCASISGTDCGAGPAWFNHFLWYVFANGDVFFPTGPTLRARVRNMLDHLADSWRPLIRASITVLHMRDIMMTLATTIIEDPSKSPAAILQGQKWANRKFPKTCAKMLLPSKYVEKRKEVGSSNPRPGKKQKTIAEALAPTVKPCEEVSTVDPSTPPVATSPSSSSPPNSTLTTVGATGMRVSLPPLVIKSPTRRSPRLALVSKFKDA